MFAIRLILPILSTLMGHSGVGNTMWQVIVGRVISGVGGAGMTALVSILITGEQQIYVGLVFKI